VKFLKQTTPNTMPFSNRPFHTLFQIAVLTSPRPPYEMKNPPMSRDLSAFKSRRKAVHSGSIVGRVMIDQARDSVFLLTAPAPGGKGGKP
ncbi:MAG: hypothetical protein NTW21_20765, partial [Verrucomicrobia bacterium]|nr:hypothetical protein [Verrucomicrobiota bacterium]